MPQGRPARSRAVLDLSESLLVPPPEIVLDTTFVVHVLVGTQPAHQGCVRFLEALARAESLVVFNRLLEIELAEVIFQLPLRERYGNRWRRYRYDGRSRRPSSTRLREAQEGWRAILSALRWSRVELDQTAPDVARLMSDYGLSSYDAIHVATATSSGRRLRRQRGRAYR